MPKKQKVFVGMSGGVDSSVAAALLKKDGCDVTGVFIKVWQADFLPCNWREERRDAMRAAAHLGIPFLTLDLEKEYKKDVVDYMIREYGAGRVPNPDVMCNKHVKFGAFLDFAKKNGADFIATGHYARIATSHKSQVIRKEKGNSLETCDLKLVTYDYRLLAGVDKEKDQSYFLWTLTQEQLAHTLFPVGHLKKSAVRALAKKFDLPNAEKKDSQGLCFMGKIDMAEFLKHYLKTQTGDVLDVSGQKIGTHDGAILYTIGQRHGFSVKKVSPTEQPFFVVGKDVAKNTITVAHRDPEPRDPLKRIVDLAGVNSLSVSLHRSTTPTPCRVRIRYRGALLDANWEMLDVAGATARVVLDISAHEVVPGQSVVAYDGEECLGGGIVS